VVNYVENHDNQTLFDINAFKLPHGTSTEDRARVQMLGAAINAFSQGVAYFHAGIDTCAASRWTATATTRATGSTAWTGPTRTTTSAPACRRRTTTATTGR
jgi:pullulanase/glycogen debranching enzyme